VKQQVGFQLGNFGLQKGSSVAILYPTKSSLALESCHGQDIVEIYQLLWIVLVGLCRMKSEE